MSMAAVVAPKKANTGGSGIMIPEGYTLHTENSSHILISSKDEAFLNPVQEFNRDLSVACIRVWSEDVNKEKKAKWKLAQERRAKRDSVAGKEAKKVKGEWKGCAVVRLARLTCILSGLGLLTILCGDSLVDDTDGSSQFAPQTVGPTLHASQIPEGSDKQEEVRISPGVMTPCTESYVSSKV